MSIHHEGNGALLGDAQQSIEAVEYTFDLDSERGLTGYLRSPNPYLPRTTALRLRLQDGAKFVAVYLGMGLYSRGRGNYAYRIFLAEDQPDDSNNLVAQRPGRPMLEMDA